LMKDAASPERTKQAAVPSFQDSIDNSCLTQGCGCFAAFTLGCAVTRFQRADSHFRLHPIGDVPIVNQFIIVKAGSSCHEHSYTDA
jgi:hypothetical protein